MESFHNEGGADEVNQVFETGSVGRVDETMPPLNINDYEDLGWILELKDLGEETSYGTASIDINTMFSDFFPEDEEQATEKNFHRDVEKEIADPPTAVLPATEPSFVELEKWMDIDPPELESGGCGDPSKWEFELMQWIWYPNIYEEFLHFSNK